MSRTVWASAARALLLLCVGTACSTAAADDVAGSEAEQKTWRAPAEGSCTAKGILKVANEASASELDVDAELDRRAADNIVAARPIATIAALDEVPYVGDAALSAIQAYAEKQGRLAACGGGAELGIVSDLDKTVIPHATPDLSAAPYPGVKALYRILELRNGGAAGDVYYVTARTPEKVTEVPAYLVQHGVPAGAIETGVSGVPWVAEAEKVRDVTAILAATGEQRFVLFGDTSHRDPEVYKKIVAAHPERIVAGFIHKVNATVSPDRVDGLYLHESYAEVAAVLYGLGSLTEAEALEVMQAAKGEGLAISDAEMQALLDAHRP